MFRRESCTRYALRFVLTVIVLLYGLQWVLGRVGHVRRFLPAVHLPASLLARPR